MNEEIEAVKANRLISIGHQSDEARPLAAKTDRPMPTACIVCGGKPLTREHLWPKWFSRLTLRRHNRHEHHQSRWVQMGSLSTVRNRVRSRTGDASSVAPKVVCKPCNSGWMSQVESAARPALSSMIRGDQCLVSPADRHAIRRWAALKMLIGEQRDEPNHRVFDGNEIEALRLDRPLRGQFAVALCPVLGPSDTWFGTTATVAARSPIVPLDPEARANHKTLLMVGGRLCLLAWYGPEWLPRGPVMPHPLLRRFVFVIDGIPTNSQWPPPAGISLGELHMYRGTIGTPGWKG